MTGGDVSSLHHAPDGCGKCQHAEEICDCGAVLPDSIGHLLLGKAELIEETLIALRLLQGIEVGALEILDKGEGKHRSVIEVAHDSRNLRPAKASSRPQSALPRDELPTTAWLRAHG